MEDTKNNKTCCDEYFPDLYLKTPYQQDLSVIEIQEALTQLGYYRGSKTGLYDPETSQAVKMFQLKNGLAPDGIVRYHVWLRLAGEIEKMSVKKNLPAPTGDVTIVIDTFRNKLTVFNNNLPYAQYPVAIGKSQTPSPIGNWKVKHKAAHWGTGFGTRWLGLDVPWGIYGIHGTNKPWSIGSMSSHGCFRMLNRDIETIYPWIKVDTPVIVLGNPFGYMSGGFQRLNAGDKGSAVRFVQEKMKRRGLYSGDLDGIYGTGTEKAVLQLQKQYQLVKTGQIGSSEYKILGIW